MLELQLDNNIPATDWRMELIYEYMSYKESGDVESADNLLEVIKKNDWHTYYKDLSENCKLLQNEYTESDYEYYEIADVYEEAMLRLELEIKPNSEEENWKNECLETYIGNKHMIRYYNSFGEFEKDNHEMARLERENKILYYSINNNIKPNEAISLGEYLKAIADYRLLVILIMIFISANSVCQISIRNIKAFAHIFKEELK